MNLLYLYIVVSITCYKFNSYRWESRKTTAVSKSWGCQCSSPTGGVTEKWKANSESSILMDFKEDLSIFYPQLYIYIYIYIYISKHRNIMKHRCGTVENPWFDMIYKCWVFFIRKPWVFSHHFGTPPKDRTVFYFLRATITNNMYGK